MVIKTIVTTDMISDIARANGIICHEVLTGFKWIAELIREKEGVENYVIGGEESYGLMIGDQLRDKDAISAVAFLCEMAAYEKDNGRSLYDKLLDLYLQHGFYKEHLVSITKKGMDGQQQIADMMERFRQAPPQSLDGIPVAKLLDYEKQEARDLVSGATQRITLPASNVLQFILTDGSKISARPSGTEPKIKFYFSVKGTLTSKAKASEEEAALDGKIQRILSDLRI
jgi:phosphoglucomutase